MRYENNESILLKILHKLSQTVQLQRDKLVSKNTHIMVGYITTFK